MSLVKPSAKINLNGQHLSSAEAGMVSIRLDLSFNTHDRLQMTVWPDSKLRDAVPGDELSVELHTQSQSLSDLESVGAFLGNSDSSALWTGTIDAVHSSAGIIQISGLASSAQLNKVKLSATWADQSIDKIIKDMAGDLALEIEADMNLSNYSIDNTRSVWSHLYELAQLTGAELSSSASGGLRFVLASKGGSKTSIRYGAELIDWRLVKQQQASLAVAAEHGAASSAGKDKWHWLAHDPVGTDAENTNTPAAFSSREAADLFSEAAKAKQQRSATQGEVWIGGRTDLRPGALIELLGLPQGDSGTLRVKSVTHQMDGQTGFITALSVEGHSDSSGFSL